MSNNTSAWFMIADDIRREEDGSTSCMLGARFRRFYVDAFPGKLFDFEVMVTIRTELEIADSEMTVSIVSGKKTYRKLSEPYRKIPTWEISDGESAYYETTAFFQVKGFIVKKPSEFMVFVQCGNAQSYAGSFRVSMEPKRPDAIAEKALVGAALQYSVMRNADSDTANKLAPDLWSSVYDFIQGTQAQLPDPPRNGGLRIQVGQNMYWQYFSTPYKTPPRVEFSQLPDGATGSVVRSEVYGVLIKFDPPETSSSEFDLNVIGEKIDSDKITRSESKRKE
ncbi:hypothetical protein [Azospirillum sp. B506]|uniref:hypothetical protein n=1 Tax=Azospirillum sp. B506 TaxID=137721 RepID=UPI0011DE393D|nr:hypothetical protein [Azospirillum sp. B506]